ncbi:MAG: hypothetical protein GX328_00225 [Clostridiaceae bacterium]|nr:hypothetical protein [Clostridiaceae bacterium]
MILKKQILSLKELILLGILIILATYYFVVHGPIKKQTDEYENRLVEIDSELQISQIKAAEMVNMQKSIDAIFDKYDGNPPMTPEYNNTNFIIGELNGILGDTYNYNLSFGAEVVDENNVNIIRRPIDISFSTSNYDDAVAKIKTINESENKYLIQNVSIYDSGVTSSGLTDRFGNPVNTVNSTQDIGRYNVVITMTSFEYNADAPQPEPEPASVPASDEDISQ